MSKMNNVVAFADEYIKYTYDKVKIFMNHESTIQAELKSPVPKCSQANIKDR